MVKQNRSKQMYEELQYDSPEEAWTGVQIYSLRNVACFFY